MKHRDRDDRTIEKMFRAAREADRAAAPGFRHTLERERADGRSATPRLRLWLVPATALAAGLTVVALASLWLGGNAPHQAPVRVAETRTAAAPAPPAPAPPVPVPENVIEETPDVASEPEAAPEPPAPVEQAPPPEPEPVTVENTSRRKTGGLGVVVVDAEGRPLPGATVTISSEMGYVKTTSALTDGRGEALYPVLRSGEGYALQISFPGLSPLRLDNQRVRSSQITRLPVQMMEELTEQVKVVAAGDVVDLDASEQSTRFSHNFISDLPVPARFYQNVMTRAPGVHDADGDGEPNVHGSRVRHYKAIVGNVSSVAPTSGQVAKTILVKKYAPPVPEPELYPAEFSTEGYDSVVENGFVAVTDHPLSTFSIDVDTASYSNVRRFLISGHRPPKDAVRIEELINYFPYDYAEPVGDVPFALHTEVAECPWNDRNRLVRIGLKGREVTRAETEGSNLVFLVDVSGSMDSPSKLPLLQESLLMLVKQLDSRDQVALVVYAGASGLVLPSTSGDQRRTIVTALSQLKAGGGTNGGAGIRLAYRIARENFIPGGVNRVILATDGDFNIGVRTRSELLDLIEKDAKDGIFLTVLGFGMGNYQDGMLEELTGRGNGNYAYIDTAAEARKVLVDQLSGTLVTIAKDVKVQVEFNPLEVGGYRLIGYENRVMPKEHFNDDRKDAGEIGAGHTVTALYEIVPPGGWRSAPAVDPLKYQQSVEPAAAAEGGELLTIKLRYKEPDEDESRLITVPVAAEHRSFDVASEDFKFAAAVAEFGMLLRDSEHRARADLAQVSLLALEGRGADPADYRSEFLELVGRAARILSTSEMQQTPGLP